MEIVRKEEANQRIVWNTQPGSVIRNAANELYLVTTETVYKDQLVRCVKLATGGIVNLAFDDFAEMVKGKFIENY
jgi:hypothetical protein